MAFSCHEKSAAYRCDILRWQQNFIESEQVGHKGREDMKLRLNYITQKNQV